MQQATELPDREDLQPEDLCPSEVQAEALASDADIVITGGANGGGKTFTVVYAPTPLHDDPNLRGVIFRRTLQQVKANGGLLDETNDIYPAFDGVLNRGDFEWRFPKGGKIQLKGLQHAGDEEGWDGAQLSYLAFDQLEQFEKRQFFYLLGRMRSKNSRWPPFCVASCNPAPPGHWLHEFIKWWLLPDGLPDYDKSGVKRYFFGSDDGWEWADGPEDYQEVVDDRTGEVTRVHPTSITFIPSKVFDNPHIMEGDPKYLQKLNSLNWVDKQRKLYGNWNVAAEGGLFERQRAVVVGEEAVPDIMPLVRYWDVADTEPSEKNPEPCYTAGALCGMTWELYKRCQDLECGRATANTFVEQCPDCGGYELAVEELEVLWILHVARFRLTGGLKKSRMLQQAKIDGKKVRIYVEQEPGSSGKDVANQYVYDLFSDFICMKDRPTGDKTTRASAWVAAAEEGRVRVLEGDWNKEFFGELGLFPFSTFKDQIDAVSGAYPKLLEYKQSQFNVDW